MALVLCFSMLLGTTFAWFTDNASTSVNKIQAGKLDVVLEVATEFDALGQPTKWEEVTEDTKLFKNVNGEDILWEPGAGAEEWFRIRNNGNLALKYQFKTNYVNATKTTAGKSLADVLQVQNVAYMLYDEAGNEITSGEALGGRDMLADMTGEASTSGFAPMKNAKYEEYLLPGESRTVYTCVVWEPTDHDNDFNVKDGLSIDLGINVLATQYTYEYDSNDNQYDKDAGFGWDGTVATQEELEAVKSTWVYSKDQNTGVETLGNLFTISSPELLAAYAQYVNEGNGNYKDKVVLTEDMDLGNQPWTPIGTAEHPFTGRVFDGQGHTISNLCVNGGAKNPTDLNAVNQGLFGFTYTNGTIVEIMNLNIHNVDIYAKNSAGAVIGCLDTAQSSYNLAGYTGVHDINLTGKVTIEGGNSGGISGSPVAHWALQTGFKNIVIDVEDGSYLSNVKAKELSGAGVGGALGGVVAVAAWDRESTNITSNLDVIGVAGNVGGVVGVGNQVWYEITCSGDVTVKEVEPSADGKYNYGLAVGGFAPVWHHQDMSAERRATISATGTLNLELTNGTTIHTNGQASDAIGGFFW